VNAGGRKGAREAKSCQEIVGAEGEDGPKSSNTMKKKGLAEEEREKLFPLRGES